MKPLQEKKEKDSLLSFSPRATPPTIPSFISPSLPSVLIISVSICFAREVIVIYNRADFFFNSSHLFQDVCIYTAFFSPPSVVIAIPCCRGDPRKRWRHRYNQSLFSFSCIFMATCISRIKSLSWNGFYLVVVCAQGIDQLIISDDIEILMKCRVLSWGEEDEQISSL